MFKRLRQLADVSAARSASIPGDSTETPNAGFLSIGKLGHEGVDPVRLHFVAIDVETTGLEPTQHRVIELAMVRFLSDGTVLDEWSTLLDPRCDVGPVEIHGIDNTQVVDAPEFSAIAGHVLARLDGAVVVGHNVGFDSRFLDCEFRRAGLPVQTLPGLCTIELQQLLDPGSQRLRLGSAAQKYGLRNPGRHSALEDARVTALLVCAQLVAAERWNKGSKVVLRVPPVTFQIPPLTAQPKVRIAGLTKGTDGWLASMVSKLPASFQPEIDPIVAHAYSNALVEVVADGKVTKMEAERLGLLAGQAGLSASSVLELHRTFLMGLREAALEDGRLSRDELTQLRRVATALGLSDDVTDLVESGDAALSDGKGVLANLRVVVVPGDPDALELCALLTASGATVAKNVTKSVGLVVANAGDQSDLRVARASSLGISVMSVNEARHHLEDRGPDEADPKETATAIIDQQTVLTTPAGWFEDPSGLFEHRYWNGSEWTDQVASMGVVSTDAR